MKYIYILFWMNKQVNKIFIEYDFQNIIELAQLNCTWTEVLQIM